MNLSDISTHWVALHEALGLGAPIADDAHYERMLAVVDQLFDAVAADPAHPLGGLVRSWPTASANTKAASIRGLTPAPRPACSPA